MAATRIFLGIICFSITGSFSLFNSYLLTHQHQLPAKNQVLRADDPLTGTDKIKDLACRLRIVKLAESEVGIREHSGQNDGKRVETYLACVGLHKGDPYCAAFVSYLFAQEGFAKPRSGWSPDLFPRSRITKDALPGNVLGIYFPELKRIAHAGIIEKTAHEWCLSIEANTNISGSREGEGVYRKRRNLKTIYRMADWILPERRAP